MSKNNQRYYKEPIVEKVQEEPIAVEAPIEEAPSVVEEPVKVSVEEKKTKGPEKTVSKSKAPSKIKGTVLLITRDGCIVETKEKGNISLTGKQYMSYNKGDIIEF